MNSLLQSESRNFLQNVGLVTNQNDAPNAERRGNKKKEKIFMMQSVPNVGPKQKSHLNQSKAKKFIAEIALKRKKNNQ